MQRTRVCACSMQSCRPVDGTAHAIPAAAQCKLRLGQQCQRERERRQRERRHGSWRPHLDACAQSSRVSAWAGLRDYGGLVGSATNERGATTALPRDRDSDDGGSWRCGTAHSERSRRCRVRPVRRRRRAHGAVKERPIYCNRGCFLQLLHDLFCEVGILVDNCRAERLLLVGVPSARKLTKSDNCVYCTQLFLLSLQYTVGYLGV